MDYSRIIRARRNRGTRKKEPFLTFFDSIDQCKSAANQLIAGSISEDISILVGRSAIVTSVSSIEVYFRDVLDWIFKYCSPDFFRPNLKAIHPNKYTIDDLLEIYEHTIHPLEMVSSSMSFQNTEQIERVFSKYLRSSLWDAVLNQQVRLKDEPENIVSWTLADLQGLKNTFQLRHELVHDPALRNFMRETVVLDIEKSAHMIWGANFVLMQMMSENKDPMLKDKLDNA